MLDGQLGQKLGSLMSSENNDDLMALRELVDSGNVAPAIDRTYPSARSRGAIRYLLKGQERGKLVITI